MRHARALLQLHSLLRARRRLPPSVTLDLSQRFTADVILKFHSRLLDSGDAAQRQQLGSAGPRPGLTSSKQFQFSLFLPLSLVARDRDRTCLNLEWLS